MQRIYKLLKFLKFVITYIPVFNKIGNRESRISPEEAVDKASALHPQALILLP